MSDARNLQFDNGGEGALAGYAGERVQVTCSVAAAPGQPLVGRFGDGVAFQIKTLRCRRDGEHFAIEARLVDDRRVIKQRLRDVLDLD